MLTTEEMHKIMVEETLGSPRTVKGPEADKFLAEFKKDLAKAKRDGVALEIPAEWPAAAD